MRVVLALVVGLLIGFMLGGVQPRRDLAERDDSIRSIQKKLAEAEKKGGRGRSAFPMPLPGMDEVVASAPEARAKGEGKDPSRGDGAVVVEVNGQSSEGAASPPPQSKEDMRREFNAAVDAQRARAQQSRQALREGAGMTEEEMEAFDGIVSEMNASLADYGDEVLSWAEAEPETRDALGVAHEVTGILYDAQTAMEQLVGDDSMGNLDEATGQIWNYVDLETFRPAVESQIEQMGDGGPSAPGRP